MRKLMTAAAVAGLLLVLTAFTAESVIPWQTLVKYLPVNFNGMPQSKAPKGMTNPNGQYAISQAIVHYGDNEQGEVNIVSGGMAGMEFQSLSAMAKMNVDTSEGYVRGTTIQDFPAIEKYDTQDRIGRVIVALPNKVIVSVSLEGCNDTTICRGVAESMNLKGLAAEK
jgi:hypothetical protein